MNLTISHLGITAENSDGSHQVWDLDSESRVARIKGHLGYGCSTLDAGNCVAVLPDGRLAQPCADGTTAVWSTSSLKLWNAQHRHAAHAPSRFSYIGGSLGYFREPRHMILAIAALADGRYITGATDGALKVWAAPPPSGIGKPLNSE